MKNEGSSDGGASINGESVERDSLSYAVIGEAMRVHTELGPGLDEVFYHNLLSSRLLERGIAHESKPRRELLHRGLKADVFECDLLFESKLIGELKTLGGPETFAPEHFAQLISYLKFWRVGTGLLLDFGKERLVYRRVVFTERAVSDPKVFAGFERAYAAPAQEGFAQKVLDCIARVIQSHGLGYRDTTYIGLIVADFMAENLPFKLEPEAVIQGDGKLLGKACCHCIVVHDKIALLVLALRDKISTTDRAVLQTYLKLLGLESGLIVNFGKRSFDVEIVYPPKSRRS